MLCLRLERMNKEELKKVIIDQLSAENSFQDLRPVDVVSITVDIVIAIFEKANREV